MLGAANVASSCQPQAEMRGRGAVLSDSTAPDVLCFETLLVGADLSDLMPLPPEPPEGFKQLFSPHMQ